MNEFGALADSGRMLDEMQVRIQSIVRDDPGQFDNLYPPWMRMKGVQLELEEAAQRGGQSLSGIFIPAIIIGGMSLLGVGGWIWKHHEEVSLERERLECIERMMDQGNMTAGEAGIACGGQGEGFVSQLSDLTRNAVIFTILAGGLYLLIKMKS